MIVALAGRRIDAPDAPVARFPLANVPLVEQRLRELFVERGTKMLVGSAACGADLIAQRVARDLGIRRVVVLPYAASIFKQRSVTDRPGDWGSEFDALLIDARAGRAEVVQLGESTNPDDSHAAYERVNQEILDRASSLASENQSSVLPVIVWDGEPRGTDDLTSAFGDAARARGLEPRAISTLE
jgi:hypothetical protein